MQISILTEFDTIIQEKNARFQRIYTSCNQHVHCFIVFLEKKTHTHTHKNKISSYILKNLCWKEMGILDLQYCKSNICIRI